MRLRLLVAALCAAEILVGAPGVWAQPRDRGGHLSGLGTLSVTYASTQTLSLVLFHRFLQTLMDSS